jgi:chaperonin GroES
MESATNCRQGLRICIAFLAKGDRVQTRNLGNISMKFRPLHDRLLVRRVEQEAKSTGGIIIPDTAQEKPMEGEVIAVGPGARGEDGKVHPLDVKTGDRVLFGKWSGTEVRLDGEELMIMKESDVMGIVDSGAAAAKTT